MTDQAWCAAITLMLQYFYTSAFTWQLVEGIHIYRVLVTVFIVDKRWHLFLFLSIGWGK